MEIKAQISQKLTFLMESFLHEDDMGYWATLKLVYFTELQWKQQDVTTAGNYKEDDGKCKDEDVF